MTDDTVPPRAARATNLLERVEHLYLLILRASVLLIATAVLIWAAWLGVSALAKIVRSPESVVEQPATVDTVELGAAIAPAAVQAAEARKATGVPEAQRRFYTDFVDRYHALYRSKFEPFRRPEDKKLDKDEFDDNFIRSTERIAALSRGEGNFGKDRDDLNALLATMTKAVALPESTSRLKAYQTARKRSVQNRVERYRTETRRGWDSLSTTCEGWFESPVGCPVIRTVTVPYTQMVTTMALPAGLLSHTQIFRTMQDRYITLLGERRNASASKAATERLAIVEGNTEGWGRLYTTVWILGGFLALMFFFLLIALERHQRRLVDAASTVA